MRNLFVVIVLFLSLCNAQELDAKVIVNYEKLPTEYREKLRNFALEVEDYLNSNRFTGDSWEWEKIKCQFNIFFVSASNQTNYSAQVVVNSQRPIGDTKSNTLMLTALDGSWSFRYEVGQTFYFNETDFDNLTSFLDFYAFLILGIDADSYDPLGGTDSFNRAYNIALMGSNSGGSGWQLKRGIYSKLGYLDELLNAKYQQFREFFCAYHLDAVDVLEKNPKLAAKTVSKIIDKLFLSRNSRQTRSIVLKVFFDAKYREIISILKNTSDKESFEKLKILDPAHISKYNEILDNMN